MTKKTNAKIVNKSDLVSILVAKTGLKNTEATKAVEAILESMIQAVARGQEVRLVGFGSFTVTSRKARQGRNPRTGATLQIPASQIPKFRPGKEFKDAVSAK
jgi:DNA-binding protein HU-beta